MKIPSGLGDDFATNWHIGQESLDALPNIEPAPEFKLGNDYRTFYDVPASSLDDQSWEKFNEWLLETPLLKDSDICYAEYCEWKKNGMKLGKYLAKLFMDNIQLQYGIDEPIQFKNTIFDNHHSKDIAKLSTARIAGETRKLMLSQNPLDHIMCSQHSTYSSCMGLHKSYGMWHTIPTTIWNPNIGYLALISDEKTEYTLRNGYKIVVPKVHARTWVYLLVDKKGTGYFLVPKQYPKEFLDIVTLNKVTGLNFVTSVPDDAKTRYKANFPVLNYNNEDTVFTPYFDYPLEVVDFNISNLSYNIKKTQQGLLGNRAIKVSNSIRFNDYPSVGVGGSYGDN